MHVHRVTAPLLLIHGDSDENPGTQPSQSKFLYSALKGLGKVARYVVLPREVMHAGAGGRERPDCLFHHFFLLL